MSSDRSRDETVGVDVVASVKVPVSLLKQEMTDQELRGTIRHRGEFEAAHQLAESISSVRERIDAE